MSQQENKNTSKYSINKKLLILIIALSILFLILYIGSVVLMSIDDFKAQTTILYVLTIIRDVSIIFFTIFGGTVISILVFEKKSKNAEYIDNMVEDVILCKGFVETLSNKNKKILAMKATGIDNTFQMKMINDIKDKLFEKNPKFYFSESEVEVCCEIKDAYIEKTIIKTVKLKSYAPICRINEFLLLQNTCKKIDGKPNLEIDYVYVDDKLLSKKEIKIEETPVDKKEHVLINNGYETHFKCLYNKSIHLNNKQDTKISIKYITRVNKDDHQYTCRVSEHCKKFKLSFQINSADKYDIFGNGFGFMESADQSPNIKGTNIFYISFSDWIFKKDGVSIYFTKQ